MSERLFALDLGSLAHCLKGEAAIRDRAGLRLDPDRSSGMTALRITSAASAR